MLVFVVIIAVLTLSLLTLTSPPPKWYFWATCLALVGLFMPPALAALLLVLVIRGMIWLYGVTMK